MSGNYNYGGQNTQYNNSGTRQRPDTKVELNFPNNITYPNKEGGRGEIIMPSIISQFMGGRFTGGINRPR